MNRFAMSLWILLSASQPSAFSSEPPAFLTVGSQAPTLHVERWLSRETVPHFERGRVYVLEFWATWCAPCVAAIPHLMELQAQLRDKGVRFIGVAAREMGTAEEQLRGLNEFLEVQSKPIHYALAFDSTGTAYKDWAVAGHIVGIPATIVIDQEGRITYVGHPTALTAEFLSRVVDGTWKSSGDAERYRVTYQENKIKEIKERKFTAELNELVKRQDWLAALSWVNRGFESNAASEFLLRSTQGQLLLMISGREDEGFRVLDGLIQASWDSIFPLRNLLEEAVNPPLVQTDRLKALNLRMAERIMQLMTTEALKAAHFFLPPVARAYFGAKQVAKAVELQRKVIEVAGSDYAHMFTTALEEFEKHAPECKDGVCILPTALPAGCKKALETPG